MTGAKDRNLEFAITKEYIMQLLEDQQGRCALSGIDIEVPKITSLNGFAVAPTASLDRIDNTKGYTPGNVQWVHKDLNMMKRSYTQERFIELCKLVAKHNE
jgi:hypothetical protein